MSFLFIHLEDEIRMKITHFLLLTKWIIVFPLPHKKNGVGIRTYLGED